MIKSKIIYSFFKKNIWEEDGKNISTSTNGGSTWGREGPGPPKIFIFFSLYIYIYIYI